MELWMMVNEFDGLPAMEDTKMPTTEREPLNARVARARGCSPFPYVVGGERPWYCMGRGHDHGGKTTIPDYEHDAAMAMRILEQNLLSIEPPEPRHKGAGRTYIVSNLQSFPVCWGQSVDLKSAIFEWYCAAKAAGVEVVEP